ncbi:MAG: trigger factor [Candidatus Hydrothermae bacterium]|nr:trigger factor [Candidatus Hydrothermae bacterium]
MKKIITSDSLKSKREINFSIPPEEVEEARKKVIADYRRRTRIPGFRPGKAPVEVIKLRFKDEIEEDTRELAVRKAIDRELEERGLEPVSTIRITEEKPGEDGSLYVTAEFEVMPDFDFPPLPTIKVEKRIRKVSEADVREELERIRKRAATYEDVDRPSDEGDFIFVEMEERDEKGKLLRKEQGYLVLDYNEMDSKLYEAFFGREKGDKVTITRKASDEKGKEREIKLIYRIKAIKEEKLPELDDNLARLLGFKGLSELKEHVRKELEARSKQDSESEFEWTVIREIYERINFELPEAMVEAEIKNLRETLDPALLERLPDAETELRKIAEDHVKRRIIITRFAERENIEVSDEELREEVEKRAREYKMSAEAYWNYLKKKGDLEYLRQVLAGRKAMDLLKERVKMEVIFE